MEFCSALRRREIEHAERREGTTVPTLCQNQTGIGTFELALSASRWRATRLRYAPTEVSIFNVLSEVRSSQSEFHASTSVYFGTEEPTGDVRFSLRPWRSIRVLYLHKLRLRKAPAHPNDGSGP